MRVHVCVFWGLTERKGGRKKGPRETRTLVFFFSSPWGGEGECRARRPPPSHASFSAQARGICCASPAVYYRALRIRTGCDIRHAHTRQEYPHRVPPPLSLSLLLAPPPAHTCSLSPKAKKKTPKAVTTGVFRVCTWARAQREMADDVAAVPRNDPPASMSINLRQSACSSPLPARLCPPLKTPFLHSIGRQAAFFSLIFRVPVGRGGEGRKKKTHTQSRKTEDGNG